MLLQSHEGNIHLLPALPEAWRNGRIKGLKARGGYTVDMAWSEGELTSHKIQAKIGGSFKLRIQDTITEHHLFVDEALEVKI
ncbi:hypothetical protein GF373_10310 [bacterium]|nr:hypothetical protein [bacterium]